MVNFSFCDDSSDETSFKYHDRLEQVPIANDQVTEKCLKRCVRVALTITGNSIKPPCSHNPAITRQKWRALRGRHVFALALQNRVSDAENKKMVFG